MSCLGKRHDRVELSTSLPQKRRNTCDPSVPTDYDFLSELPTELLVVVLELVGKRKLKNILRLRLISKLFKNLVAKYLIQGVEIEAWIEVPEEGKLCPSRKTQKLKALFPELQISGIQKFAYPTIGDASSLALFSTVKIACAPRLRDISSFRGMRRVHLCNCTVLADLSPLSDTPVVVLSLCGNIRDLTPLALCNEVVLHSCQNISNISALSRVKTVSITSCAISDISALRTVRTLHLAWLPNVRDVSMLGGVHTLQLYGLLGVTSLEGLECVPRLVVYECSITSLPKFCGNLFVSIAGCPLLCSLGGGPINVETLVLASNQLLTTIDPKIFRRSVVSQLILKGFDGDCNSILDCLPYIPLITYERALSYPRCHILQDTIKTRQDADSLHMHDLPWIKMYDIDGNITWKSLSNHISSISELCKTCERCKSNEHVLIDHR